MGVLVKAFIFTCCAASGRTFLQEGQAVQLAQHPLHDPPSGLDGCCNSYTTPSMSRLTPSMSRFAALRWLVRLTEADLLRAKACCSNMGPVGPLQH